MPIRTYQNFRRANNTFHVLHRFMLPTRYQNSTPFTFQNPRLEN